MLNQKIDSNKTTANGVKSLNILKNRILIRIFLGMLIIVLTVVLIFALTTAWQTNIIQTGGLNFTAEKWNFSGDVTIDSTNINIAPGRTGAIELSISNDSALIASVSVNVSKNNLDNRMHKRLYFYIDTPSVRNNEQMDKIWLNSRSTYTYSMFPYTALAINEKYKDAPLLKWTWVYDVVGYYVLGFATPTEQESDVYRMVEEEYLRPIEYDFDMSKTTFDSSGYLETIDGVTTAFEFIAELTKNDGYDGVIDKDVDEAYIKTKVKATGGYYPIDVDENGYGVWAYLCSLDEITQNIDFDTKVGNGTEEITSLKANVIITGHNSNAMTVSVSDEAELLASLLNDDVAMVKLEEDVVLSDSLIIDKGSSTWIDLNGHKLTGLNATTVIHANPGSVLMVQNGTISGTGDNTAAITANGAIVTLDNVTVTDSIEGLFVRDNLNNEGLDSKISIINSDILCKEDGLLIYGNTKSEKFTEILIRDSNIVGSTYTGIICNGTHWGTQIDIINSTVDGYYASIYFPQKNSILNITDSKMTGNTGVVAKGGTINIVDSNVYARGPYVPISDISMSGWTDSGDAIYLETNYGFDTELNISGNSKIQSIAEGTLAVREYPLADNVSINITGGSFSSSVESFLSDDYIQTDIEGDGNTFYIVSEKEQVVTP